MTLKLQIAEKTNSQDNFCLLLKLKALPDLGYISTQGK